MELYNIQSIYEEFVYPKEFMKLLDLNLLDFEFWYLMTKEQTEIRIKGLRNRYPMRKLVPFARRDDCDDIACFEVGKNGKVQIIHDFASCGYEQKQEYENFWSWFRSAINELIDNVEY